jgi:uncharacterized transporter YbjL
VLSLVSVAGLALGAITFRGAGLGVAGVLFAGIVVGHFGKPVDTKTLDFVRDFGLILFVFTIGLQLGPGFFAALRQQGVTMNALAAAIVALGAVIASVVGGSRTSTPRPCWASSPARRSTCRRLGPQLTRSPRCPGCRPTVSRCPLWRAP